MLVFVPSLIPELCCYWISFLRNSPFEFLILFTVVPAGEESELLVGMKNDGIVQYFALSIVYFFLHAPTLNHLKHLLVIGFSS